MKYIITRSYNSYTFDCGGRSFVIDLDKTDEPIIGVSGKPLKNMPSQIDTDDIGYCIYCAWCEHSTDFPNREYIDRIISLQDEDKECLYDIIRFTPSMNEELWKKIFKIFRSGKLKETPKVLLHNVTLVIKYWENFEKAKKYGLEEILSATASYTYTDDVNFILENKALRQIFRKVLIDEYAIAQQRVKQQFFDGLDDKTIEERYGIKFKHYDKQVKLHEAFDYLHQCREYLSALNLDEKSFNFTNLKENCKVLSQKYDAEQYRLDNIGFSQHQTEIALEYENDIFKIFVPHSREELEKIGNRFHNCANHWEWNHRLKNGNYYLVTIIRKATNKMEVCLDINSNDKGICQFYADYNQPVVGRDYSNFKKEYQTYLKAL